MYLIKKKKKNVNASRMPKEYGINRSELELMSGTEPLNEDGRPPPHIAKLEKVVQLKMEDKIV